MFWALRLKVLFILAMILITVYAFSGPVTTNPIVPGMKWQPVYGTSTKGGFTLMVDVNSLKQMKVDRETISVGDFMVSSEKEVSVTDSGKTFKARSIIKGVAVECKSGVASVFYDMYFMQATPKMSDEVVAVKEYKENYFNLGKKNPIYQTLCPIAA